MCVGEPGIVLERRARLCARPPRSTAARASASSIGTTASPYRAMPRRSPSASSSACAERERRVLGGVVVAGLEVADALEHQVEAGMEGELLEEVVVEARAGGDPHAARAVERETRRRNASRRSRARARDAAPAAARQATAGRARARAPRRAGRRPSASRTDARIASGIRADDEPLAQQRVAERRPVVDRDVEEVRVRRRAAARPSARSAEASRSRSSITGARVGRRRRARRARASAASVETGAGAWRAFSSSAMSRRASA